MLSSALRLPWKSHNVPHGLIDIIRGCNVVCENCYNNEVTEIKSFEEVIKEIDLMIQFRKLHSLALIGGEPLLHPDLSNIIKYISNKNIHVELFSNGVLLTEAKLKELKELGVKIIFIHVEHGQQRGDLPKDATEDDVRALRIKIANKIHTAGIEVGMSLTSYKENMMPINRIIDETITQKSITYLLVTLFRDVDRINNLKGQVPSGFTGDLDLEKETKEVTYTNHDIIPYIKEHFSFSPFAFLGSNKDKNDPRWLSYMIAVFYPNDGSKPIFHALKPSWLERGFLFLYHLVMRRYPFYQEQNEKQTRLVLKLNALLGGDKQGNHKFLNEINEKKGTLKVLRLLFQSPAQLSKDGELTFCDNCPDAVIKNGKLVPVCISDRVATD